MYRPVDGTEMNQICGKNTLMIMDKAIFPPNYDDCTPIAQWDSSKIIKIGGA